MARKIYANLAPYGWVKLSDDPDSVISRNYSSPSVWWSEGGLLDSLPINEFPEKLEKYPFVWVNYKGHDYRVSPFDFQIVTTD